MKNEMKRSDVSCRGLLCRFQRCALCRILEVLQFSPLVERYPDMHTCIEGELCSRLMFHLYKPLSFSSHLHSYILQVFGKCETSVIRCHYMAVTTIAML